MERAQSHLSEPKKTEKKIRGGNRKKEWYKNVDKAAGASFISIWNG